MARYLTVDCEVSFFHWNSFPGRYDCQACVIMLGTWQFSPTEQSCLVSNENEFGQILTSLSVLSILDLLNPVQ